MDLKEAELALSKAKINLMARADSAFFTHLCFSLRSLFDTHISTACTNGKEIRINPVFFMGLTLEEKVFLLLHETLHCAYLHMLRLTLFEPRRWNIACDHVINLQLIERGFKMPKGGLADPKYKGLNAEEVYRLLPQDAGKDGFDMDLEPSEGPAESLEQEMEDILIRAAVQSKMSNDKPGTIPGDIEIFINGLLNPKLPWHRIVAKYLRKYAKVDYSFKKPNRRFFPKHHLPSLHGQSLIDLAIAVDASASVTDQNFHQFITETHSLFYMMKPEKITLIQFDTAIKSVDEIKDLRDLMNVKFTGRGGTEITEVIDWANEHRPQLLLVFTDGEFDFRDNTTKVDTLWLIHNNSRFKAEFGKVVHYNL